jgi:hypothetical protein
MDRAEYLKGVNEYLYQGEVLGEFFFHAYLAQETDPERRFKWATLMQLESETKTRLRPFLSRLGLSVVEVDPRQQLGEYVASYHSKTWRQHMAELKDFTEDYLKKFRELDSAAPESERKVTHSMIPHEEAIRNFAMLELAGDAAGSLNDVIAQLNYPLVRT